MSGPGAGAAAGLGRPGAKPADFRNSVKRLLRLLAPQRVLLATSATLAVAAVALSVVGPKLLGRATDLVFTGFFGAVMGDRFPPGTTNQQAVAFLHDHGQGRVADMVSSMHVIPGHGIDFDALGHVLAWVVGIYACSSALTYLQGLLTTQVVQQTVRRLRADVADKLQRLPLSYFDGRPRGEITSRVTNDIDNIAQTLQQTMSQLLTSVLTIVGVLGMMLWMSPLLAAVALVTVPVSMYAATRIGKRAQPEFVAQWMTVGRLNGHIEEIYSAHSVVRAFGRQQLAIDRFDEHNAKLYEASFRAQFVSGLIQPAMMFIGNLNYVLVAVIGGLRVATGTMSIGDVQAFIQYSRQFAQPIGQLASMANFVQSGVASAERVFQLLDAEEEEPDPVLPARPGKPAGRVVFDEVSFRYHPDVPLIDRLSLVVEPGRTIAIVGPTGAGKTTLVNLLMRFYELTGGRITLDGVDTATLTRADLRRSVGMVLQDAWLFGGTIAENIAYGVPTATREEIVAAAVATHVDHFVRTLPDGYDTLVDENGANLAAGERQLVTIARAFLSRPSILILDEATSSVDTRTELLVQRAMTSLRRGRTSFVIAHRLSTVRDADQILVMDAGRIVESGGHENLLSAGGVYARLYEAQFAPAAVEVG